MGQLHQRRYSGPYPQGRPWPHQNRSLVAVIEELSDSVRALTDALLGEVEAEPEGPLAGPPAADDLRAAAVCPQPEEAARAEALATEAQAVEAATADWDAPWYDLPVRQLRSLVRDLPIDRSSLPAPIELMRRSELIEALNQVQDISW